MEPVKSIKDELNRLLDEAYYEYFRWYERKSRQSQFYWHCLQVLAILPGFITGVLAAFNSTNADSFFSRQWLIWLPVGGSFAGTILTQFKIYDVWKIREDGKVAFEGLINSTRGKISLATTDEELGKIYIDLQQRINEIETEALKKFFTLSSTEFVAKFQKVTP